MNILSESVNLFNFPLNVTIVDDDIDYLDLIKQKLENFAAPSYVSPLEAIKHVKPININIKHFLEEKFIGTQDLNYYNIKNFAMCHENKHGILIADYDMPDMNGVELFSKYKNSDLIKILLTNVYTTEEAVNALNNKFIDYYLPKERISIMLDVIREQQNMFFSNITKNILDFVDIHSLNFLFNETYVDIFNAVCQQYNIVKYYVLNSYGHYYMESTTDKFNFSIYNSADLFEIAEEIPNHNRCNVKQGNLIPSSLFANDARYQLISANKHGDYSYCVEKIV